jgi:GNAT superfamily N-acetyltransferase
MPVRDATRSDLDEILTMVHELATYEREPDAVVSDRDVFAANVFGPDAVARALIAEAPDGDVAGFAIWFRTFSTWLGTSGIWLEDLFVRPEFRRFGLGRELLAELRTRTTGRVEWAVLDWNTDAHAFYRSLGAAPNDEWTTWRLQPVDVPPG